LTWKILINPPVAEGENKSWRGDGGGEQGALPREEEEEEEAEEEMSRRKC
jgi:hypothetical protein